MLVKQHQLTLEPGDVFGVEQIELKKKPAKPDKKFETLIIRGTGTPSARSAKNVYTSGRNLVHLILGQDGNTIIQTTDFTRQAGSGFRFEATAIVIGLVNVGYLIEDNSQKSHFRHIDNFAPGKRIFARGANDHKQRYWPCYPDEQLDLLLQVSSILMNHYGIKFVRSYDELNSNALNPGPTFPMVSFIEQLRNQVPDLENKPLITRKTNKPLHLLTAPNGDANQLTENPMTQGTLVSAVDESGNWSLVEVLGEKEHRWLTGWVRSDDLQLSPFVGKINNHMLETQEGASFPYIPAGKGNFSARKDSNRPKYLVMHYTTGTQLQSTINTFRNSGNSVSTHLVIGRDGRVIQMVPFNHAAYHCGSGSWEGDRNLNTLTIGIELDNAGQLTKNKDGKWTKRAHVIPDQQVQEALHWKDRNVKTYERFTEVQLDVAKRVAKALIEYYDLKDIIGHDEISLQTRYDPGPLFPLSEWRAALIGQQDPKVIKYATKTETEIYKDHEGVPPRLNHPLVPDFRLKNQQAISTIIRKEKPYSLIKVRKGNRVSIGWVESDAIKILPQITKIHKENVDFYHHFADGGPPPIKHPASPLPQNTKLRIMKVDGGLALVVTLERMEKFPFVQGWVERENIEAL